MFKSFHHLDLTLLGCQLLYIRHTVEAIGCPSNWFMFQDKCYGLHTIPQTWQDAETDCQQYSKQSHLASVGSKMEQEMIASHITTNYRKSKGVWIGLYDSCMKECFLNSFSTIPYISWDATFPRPRKYTSCIQLSASSGFKKWKNRNCLKKAEYLCMTRT